LWKQLGVVRGDHDVTFDNRAALASIRAEHLLAVQWR